MRLTAEQRKEAPLFYKALSHAKTMAVTQKSTAVIKASVTEMFAQQEAIKLEYFEIVDKRNLTAVEHVDSNQELIICIAGWMGDVRLIDNIFI
jgi:pantoate--beta-alanine ligase